MSNPGDLLDVSASGQAEPAPASGGAQRLPLDRTYGQLAQKAFPGPNYLTWLERIHEALNPRNYLEIGIATGGSLSRVPARTHVVGIDPAFRIEQTLSAPCRLFRETSDDFFAARNPAELFAGPVDLAFMDGLHTFDQTFRDIVNTARYCDDKSVILVHDVLPVHEIVARRERATRFWTGDVWKVGPMISQLMPKVEMLTVPTFPSGLMVLKNLAGAHEIDAGAWQRLEAELMARPFPETSQELSALSAARRIEPGALRQWMRPSVSS